MWDKEDRQILMVNSTVDTTCGKENKDRWCGFSVDGKGFS